MPERKRPLEPEAVVRSEAQIREAFVARNRGNRFTNPNLMQIIALQLATPRSTPEEQDTAMQTAGNIAIVNPLYNALLRRQVPENGRKIGLAPLEQLETQFSTVKRNGNTWQRTLGTYMHGVGDDSCYQDAEKEMWKKHGKLHRDNDKPAMMWVDGRQEWYQHNKRHRDNDKPAVIWADGSQAWYQHGKRYRDNDKPAMIRAAGMRIWYQHGKRRRDDDKPPVILADGTRYFSCDP
jgi:hypothetical protein